MANICNLEMLVSHVHTTATNKIKHTTFILIILALCAVVIITI